MNRLHSILPAALVLVLVHCLVTSAVDYSIFAGYDDTDYGNYGKYKVFGLMDAFDEMGLTPYKCLTSTPWQFYENMFVDQYWTYQYPGFDSERADYSTLTVHCGHAGTFKDASTNTFYCVMRAKGEWGGSNAITSDILRLGESEGYFWGDPYPGYCRYFMALGCNTVAIGPAMSDNGHPTFSRPDLFSKTNPNHADPNNIWKPVMTNGLRMVMGHTDYEYGSIYDQSKYRRFKEYHDLGYSIAWSFANTALDAYSNHKPVVLTLGQDRNECIAIMNEPDFQTGRPNGANELYCRWWGADRVRNYDGWYVWSGANGAGAADAGAGETAPLPSAGWAYDSSDSTAVEDATLVKYLTVLGVKNSAMLYDSPKERTIYKIADGRQVSIDRRTDCLLYQDTSVLALSGPSGLSGEECIDRAMSFLIGNKIVGPNEVEVDSVVKESYMMAAKQGTEDGSYSSQPQVARYTVVFKRNVGELPVLTDDTDTIRVEIGQNGKVASLVSRYKYGRTISKVESLKGALPNVQQAKIMLSTAGDIKSIKAGMLPMPDGTYLPVYEVVTVTLVDGLLPRPQITYHRMDTLEPVDRENASTGDDYQLGSDELLPEGSRQ